VCDAFFLAFWAYGFGIGLEGNAFPLFFLSGIIGIGIGDVALFQALPRLGSRLSLLLIQCLTAPFGALIEWLWPRNEVEHHADSVRRDDSGRRGDCRARQRDI